MKVNMMDRQTLIDEKHCFLIYHQFGMDIYQQV